MKETLVKNITDQSINSQSITRVLIAIVYTLSFLVANNSDAAFIGTIYIGWSMLWLWITLSKQIKESSFLLTSLLALDTFAVTLVGWISGPTFMITTMVLYVWLIIGYGYRFGSMYIPRACFLSLIFITATASITQTKYIGVYTIQLSVNLILFSIFAFLLIRRHEDLVNVSMALADKASRAERMAKIDPLTGLCNRAALQEIMDNAPTPAGLLFIDLDKFKSINDQYGHQIGDEVLKVIGQRIKRTIRSKDIACRYGGDEFLVMVDGDESTSNEIAQRILQSINKPIRVGDIMINITGSVGITLQHDTANDNIIKIADLAMYDAKHKGGNVIMWVNK